MDVKMAADEGSWRTNAFRQSVVAKIDEAIQRSGMPTTKNSMEMENHVYQKAKSKEEYLGFVARLILHVREMNSKKGGGMGGPGSAGGQAMPPDPINALQTLARQGTGNSQMMGIGVPPQAPPQIPASNLLQSLNQRPVQGLAGLPTLQNKMSEMGMGPGAQVGPMGQMPGQMQGQMPGQMRMQMPGQMGGQMPGQLPGQMPGQMQTQMQGQMPGQMPGQMQGQMPGQMPGQITHLAQMQGNENILMTSQNTGFPGPGPRNVTPTQFLRQSPSPSAPSPAGLTQAPNSNQMAASSPALVPSPGGQMTPMSVPQRSVGMAPSPSSSLNTPGPAVPTPSPCSLQEDQAYREKVRQLSKYIEPLRRMIARMGNDDVEKLSKMKKLLEILSNPSKRMPLETLLKCEVVLEKLDLKRGEGSVAPQNTHLAALKEHHIFNPLLEAVSTTLQSPVVNHTFQRTFGPCLEALFGPEIKMLPPPLKKKKVEEPPNDIPEVLQGEIARLDQRFKLYAGHNYTQHVRYRHIPADAEHGMLPHKVISAAQFTVLCAGTVYCNTPPQVLNVLEQLTVPVCPTLMVSLDPTQQPGSRSVQLICWLDDRHLPCVPPVSLSVPEDYPQSPPRCHMAPHEYSSTQFLSAVQKALVSRIRKLPSRFSVSQLLDTWEMSVRQASAPTQTPVCAATVLMGL